MQTAQRRQIAQQNPGFAEQTERDWRVRDVEQQGDMAEQTEREWKVRDVQGRRQLAEETERDWGIRESEREGAQRLEGQSQGVIR